MKVLILNGPNLNMLGTRDQSVYGDKTLDDLEKHIRSSCPQHEIEFYQSNVEGLLIDKIQEAVEAGCDVLVANFGAYTHTSVALRDALEPLDIPKVEVHISNIHAREEFREKSLTGEVMDGIITGFGFHSYLLGIQAAEHLHSSAD